MQDTNRRHPNFFIDYDDVDLPWAEWIAWQLEDAHYTVLYRKRDFLPGLNIVQKTDQAVKAAKRVLVVISPDYLKAYATGKTFSGIPVWTSTLFKDSSGQMGKLLPVRVRICHPKGLLEPIIPIDFVGLDESRARIKLLDGVNQEQQAVTEKPVFPGAKKVDTPKPAFPPSYCPPIWHVPRDNPFFTDREGELMKLYEALKAGPEDRVHTHVINGLGGIGKTQVALAYAYNYRHHYEAVFWANASDHSTLFSSIAHLIDVLKLKISKVEKQNEQIVNEAVKRWLEEHANWLLILDNIEDPRLANKLVPSIGKGHVLFTARTQATGTIASTSFMIDELRSEDGGLLLLKRAKKLETYDSFEHISDSDRAIVLKLSRMLGNLPLMLDQAGAYIEDTGIDVLSYLGYYSNSAWRHELLFRRGEMTLDHPDPVVETWNPAFEAVQRSNPAAYDLLRFCSFLHHDAIPEEIITLGAAELLPTIQPFTHNPLQKDRAIAALRKHSLLYQDTTSRTFSMNRMVQEVLRDKMGEAEQLEWAERVIVAVHRAFLAIEISRTALPLEELCPRYFSHVQACACHIRDWNMASTEAAQLLYRMGSHLHNHVQQAYSGLSAMMNLEYAQIADVLESYAMLLKKMNQPTEATELVAYADIIRAKSTSSV